MSYFYIHPKGEISLEDYRGAIITKSTNAWGLLNLTSKIMAALITVEIPDLFVGNNWYDVVYGFGVTAENVPVFCIGFSENRLQKSCWLSIKDLSKDIFTAEIVDEDYVHQLQSFMAVWHDPVPATVSGTVRQSFCINSATNSSTNWYYIDPTTKKITPCRTTPSAKYTIDEFIPTYPAISRLIDSSFKTLSDRYIAR